MRKRLEFMDRIGKYRPLIICLSAVVVFVTTYMLILPALTLDKDEAKDQGGIDVPAAEQMESAEEQVEGAEAEEDTDVFPGTLVADVDGYSVSIDFDKGSGLTEETTLIADEILNKSGHKKEFKTYQQKALRAIEEKTGKSKVDLEMARFYDISLHENGEEIEPSDAVDVFLDFEDQPRVSGDGDFYIIHFTENAKTGEITAAVLDEEDSGFDVRKNKVRSATFTTDSFSVYGIVYTVDFHYDVDGESFDYSIPGGGFISLTELVKKLQIDKEAGSNAEDFVRDVKNVEFSDPVLAWVGKTDRVTTVGELKKDKGLESEHSGALTKEEIAEINATELSAGDWVLISLKPFTSEESLTVTMKNGEQFVVRVTDFVYGAFGHDVKIDIIGNGSIELTEYQTGQNSPWDDEEKSKIYFSARTVPMSLSYFAYNPGEGKAGNNGKIMAHSGQGYVFDHWELNGQTLTDPQFAEDTIDERTLYFHYYGQADTLTAVFRKTGGGGGDINIDDIIQAWTNNITNDQPVVDKTASVYDYENRVYKIDITASSELYAISRDLDIDFVTDVSRSMLFPSKLDPVKSFNTSQEFINQLDAATRERHNGYLPNSTDPGELYYIILNPKGASDVYVVRKYNGKWWRLPASKSDEAINVSEIRGKVGNTSYDEWRELNSGIGDENGNVVITSLTYSYGHPVLDNKIYTATDETDRLEYLKQALNLVKQVLYKVDPDAKIGLTTFAKTANAGRFYTNTEQEALNNAITNITVDDNTDQAAGLAAGKTLLDSDTDNTKKKVVVLITDGAPNAPSTSPYAPLTWDKIQGVARDIKNEGIDIYTVGLSLENVQGASDGLFYTSSNSEPGKHGYAFDARDGLGLVEAVQSIIESVIVKASMTGSVSDVIDPAFYPVDKDGNPLDAGKEYEDEQGHKYTLTQSGNTWVVNWSNQEFKWAYTDDDNVKQPGWKGTVYVKAKEDFLGGNKIKTNSGTEQDKVVVNGYKTTLYNDDGEEIGGKAGPLKNEDGSNKTITKQLETPKVNVDELKLTNGETSWTVYADSTVDPMTQLRNLYNNIDVSEVVTATGNDHRMTGSKNPDHDADSERFPLSNITGQLTEDQILTLLNGGELTLPYGTSTVADGINAYGHSGLGTIKLTLTKTYANGENQITSADKNGNGHTANKVGQKVEQYTLTASYIPDTNGASTTYTNTVEGKAGAITETMSSVNKHDITVIHKGIKITKVDMTNNNKKLTGATFALYRADQNGTADVSDSSLPAGNYTLVSDDLTVDSNGVINIDPVIPDKVSGTDKNIYLPNNTIGAATASHDTVFYLVEKTAPDTYVKMPGAIRFTLDLSETKTDKITDRNISYHGAQYKNALTLYDWTQTAAITGAEEVLNGTGTYLIADGETGDIYAYRIKNGKPTDITILKVDKTTGGSIGGAKFSLKRGSESVDLTKYTITAINGGGAVTPEDFDFNGTTIKVITIPEGGVKIAGLPDGSYELQEVAAPAGYIITDAGRTFTTENGVIKNHQDEAENINFKVENEPGKPLPHTGGMGTTIFYVIGILLILGSGIALVSRRRIN